MRLAPRMVSRRGYPKKMEQAVPAEDKESRKDFCTKHHITPQWVCAHRRNPPSVSHTLMAVDSHCQASKACNPSPCHITTLTRNAKCSQVWPYQPALR